jgi:hypothetical protein
MRRSRKPLNLQGFREFESHPHRQKTKDLAASQFFRQKAHFCLRANAKFISAPLRVAWPSVSSRTPRPNQQLLRHHSSSRGRKYSVSPSRSNGPNVQTPSLAEFLYAKAPKHVPCGKFPLGSFAPKRVASKRRQTVRSSRLSATSFRSSSTRKCPASNHLVS